MKQKKAIVFSAVMGILLCVCLSIINRNIYNFESIHLIGRNFEEGELAGNYRLTAPETLRRGTYTFEFKTSGSTNREHWVLFSDENILAEGPLGESISYEVQQSSERISAGVYYGGENPAFTVSEINYSSAHVLTRDSLLYHLSLSVLTFLFFGWLIFRCCFPQTFARTIGRILTASREKLLLFLLLLTALSCVHLYSQDYIKGDDSTYHIARIEGVKTTLENGIFPPRIYLYYLNGYGFAGGIFYPDIMLYFPALLRLLGFHFVLTYKIYIFALSFLNMLAMYVCVSCITGERSAGLVGAVLYGFNAYRLINATYRGAVGELQAFCFLPLIILGLYELFSGRTRKWWILTLGCTGIVLSHLISTALAGGMIAVFLLLNLKKIAHTPGLLKALLRSFLVSLGLCAFFLLPFAEQYFGTEIITSHKFGQGVPVWALLQNEGVWKVPVRPYPGFPLLFGSLCLLLPKHMPGPVRKIMRWCAALGFLSLFFCTSAFPWDSFTALHHLIQFPWRFYILAIPLLVTAEAISCAYGLNTIERKQYIIILLCFSLISVVPIFRGVLGERKIPTRGYKLEDNRVGDKMYLPQGFEEGFPDKNRDTVLFSDPEAQITSHKRNKLSFTCTYENAGADASAEIPLFYYRGYHAYLDTGEKTIEVPTSQGPHGLVQISIGNLSEGRITVRYEKTAVQWTGDIVTLLTVVFCGIMLWKKDEQEKE